MRRTRDINNKKKILAKFTREALSYFLFLRGRIQSRKRPSALKAPKQRQKQRMHAASAFLHSKRLPRIVYIGASLAKRATYN